MPEVLAEVRQLRRRFAATAAHDWGPCTAADELQVQMGHLAVCLLRRDHKDVSDLQDPQRPINNLGDELADVVLAALSVVALAGTEPAPVDHPPTQTETDALLHLLATTGALSEVAMVDQQYRHRPTGRVPSLPQATGAVVAACEVLAGKLGIDLLSEFRAMTIDAHTFLDELVGDDG